MDNLVKFDTEERIVPFYENVSPALTFSKLCPFLYCSLVKTLLIMYFDKFQNKPKD
jgi:hypothetical protein